MSAHIVAHQVSAVLMIRSNYHHLCQEHRQNRGIFWKTLEDIFLFSNDIFWSEKGRERDRQNNVPTIFLEQEKMLHWHNSYIDNLKAALERMPSDEYRVVISADKKPTWAHARHRLA